MLARSAGEYLTEEAQIVVTGTELEEFCADVDELAADVDRAEAALRLLREEYAADDEFEDDPESGA
jgi:ubiquinone biosynthesis protein UbiJ